MILYGFKFLHDFNYLHNFDLLHGSTFSFLTTRFFLNEQMYHSFYEIMNSTFIQLRI